MSEERRPLHLAALAGAAVSGLDPVGVAEVYDADREHVAALVIDSKDRRWLVEEPVSVVDSAAEELAAPLLPLLDQRLPYAVPRPTGSTVVKEIGRVTVTPWLEDHRVAFDDIPPGPGLAAEIGRLLAAVHNLDPALYDEAGVPTYDAEAYRRRRLSELDRAAATGHVPTGLLTRWEEALELVPLWRFAATPVHGSFDGDCLRVRFTDDEDAGTGRITTVTSWHHARVGDPADDFAALYEEAHPDTFDSVLEAYAQARHERPDRGLETRARLAAELEPVAALLRAHAARDEVVVEEIAGQLRILDAETAEHPLLRRPARAGDTGPVAPAEDDGPGPQPAVAGSPGDAAVGAGAGADVEDDPAPQDTVDESTQPIAADGEPPARAGAHRHEGPGDVPDDDTQPARPAEPDESGAHETGSAADGIAAAPGVVHVGTRGPEPVDAPGTDPTGVPEAGHPADGKDTGDVVRLAPGAGSDDERDRRDHEGAPSRDAARPPGAPALDGEDTTELAIDGVAERPARAAGSRSVEQSRAVRFTAEDTVEIAPRRSS